MATVFFSYSHKDEELRDRLEIHLAMLKRQGFIEAWHDRRITVGDEIEGRISAELERADIILLLVSPDFLASNYCYDIEVKRAMERHKGGSARIIPVILRHCDWPSAPFGKLLVAPKDGRPIRSWPDLDEAFLDVVRMIKAALPNAKQQTEGKFTTKEEAAGVSVVKPRSSNLRVKKKFTDADKDKFLDEAFSFMARFFENSLEEIKARNQNVDFNFKRIDANRFTAVAYLEGRVASRCKVVLGGMFGRGITFSHNDRGDDGSINETLSAEGDEQGLYLTAFGLPHFGDQTEKHLTFEGAAEYYWALFLEGMQ